MEASELRTGVLCLIGLVVCTVAAAAQEGPPQWIAEGPYVDARSFSIELPLEVLATKLYVEVTIGGKPRRFVFDTGSPSMMNAALAAELGLKAVDRRAGKDAHGVVVESDIVQTDMTLGGVTFRKVPMFAADLSASGTAQCLIGDGVLGSEILPLCAWQIDLPQSVLRCSSDLNKLHHVKSATRQRLYDFGYPHAPILDVRFADEAVSKAMFDTGSPEYLSISPPDFEGARRAGGVGRTIAGYGSPGGSLGGQAPHGKQLQGELKTLSIGGVALGRVGATLRESPPSLIGASLLEHFIVTLDARSESAYFDPYREGPFARQSFGFTLAFDDGIAVALVWEDSPAAKAGLRAGLHLTSINGGATTSSCDGIQKALKAMSGETVQLEWEGGAATLTREFRILPQ